MLVELKGVSKAFKTVEVLHAITLSIDQGEIFGLIGPSGAGKTTLIRLIIGAVGADSGTITVSGQRIPNLVSLRKIGYMPQNDALYDDLTGMENLLFFGGMYNMSRRDLKTRASAVMELVEMGSAAARRVGTYSGGMKKRLSLAVAMLHNPELLILDEPTVGIDPILRRKIWERFDTLKAEGHTLLVTTHVMDEAVHCDRLGLVYNGGILACDTTKALLERSGGSIESLFLNTKESAE
ncbi:MAG: ABC transporter ATP-binding protein [Oscillospiraceae bacterium]